MTEDDFFPFPPFPTAPEEATAPLDPDPPWWAATGKISDEERKESGLLDGEWDWADFADEGRDHE